MNGKFRGFFILLLTSFSALLSFAAFAGEPTDNIKACTDRLLAIVSDYSPQSSDMKKKREQIIMEEVDKVFSWEEFAKRALAKNWNRRTSEERKEFVSLFRRLIANTYMEKTYQYSGESITYLDEKIEGDYGKVTSVFNTSDGKQIPVEYRIMNKGGSWLVYDLHIEGVSLVGNYRSQFNDIIAVSSYEELAARLREKSKKD
ncbi:MAG: ABC transporter substrate-binding protein [Deltaproteobacteria bacterium]|nr:ABC transporter substrate-binding protein [Deltaproteobacteria bacterium]